MTTKIIQRRGKNIMRDVTIKMFLIGLVLFIGKAPALAQDIDIKCEVSGLDLNLSGKSGYLIEFGSFFLSEKGEKGAITKFYKLPKTKLILSVLAYSPEDGALDDTLIVGMVLSKKRFPKDFPDSDEKDWTDTVSRVQVGHPIKAFDEESKGKFFVTFLAFLGKKEPIQIMMMCKKAGA